MRPLRWKDPFLWMAPVLLWLFGLCALFSLSRAPSYPVELAWRQTVTGALGLGLGSLVGRIPWASLVRCIPYLGGLAAVLLLAVLSVGSTVNGATRWLVLGPLGSFQPSEFAKLVALLITAQLWAEADSPARALRSTGVVVALFSGLIFLQPDLGTALVLALSCTGLAFLTGAPWRPLAGLALAGLALLPWLLSDYQWKRIAIFLDPQSDPAGAGWNLEQSKIAIGSGGLWGKGAFLGLQGPLDFLPEAHSDFIFAVLNEEYGFLACLLIALLSATLVGRLWYHARRTRHPLRQAVLYGLAIHFALHGLLNTAMTIGLAPVTGSPLPFVSYGGTALLLNFLALGWAESALQAQRFGDG